MSVKQEKFESEGEVTEALRGRRFRVRLGNGHETLDHVADTMKRYRIKMFLRRPSQSRGLALRSHARANRLSLPKTDSRQSDRLVLGTEHLRWIEEMGDAQAPPVSATTMLGRLVDEAMARHSEGERRRAERLEVYEASGYSEHHPDYPNLPRDV